jgi:hypothetical protein
MKLKKLLTAVCLLFLAAPLFQHCKKYEEGPMFSLRTKTERLSNNWKVENYTINGTDFTSLVSSYTETFTTDKKYSYDWGILDGDGTWAFQNSYQEVKLSGSSAFDGRVLFILKLEEKNLWYYYMDGTLKVEVHLIPK